MRSRIDIVVNLGNLSRFVNNDGNALAETAWIVGGAEKQTQVTPRVHKQREIQVVLLGEFLVRFRILDADTENLSIMLGKSARLIPERANLRRSATGKILGIKRQHDASLPFKLAELMYFAIFVGGDEVRRWLSYLKFARHILLNELNDIRAMIRNINIPINDSDVSGFVNNERNAIGGVEPLHYPAINLADRKLRVGKQ